MIKFYLFKTFVLLFLLLGANPTWAQTRVTGKVTSAEDGTGLPGVSILEKGTSNGTVTDVEGNYSFVVTAAPGYRLIPSKEGLTFAPVDKVLTGMMEEQKVVDFVGLAEAGKP